MEFVTPEGLRLDGRRPKELRQMRAELGVLSSASGSALFEMGNTKVLAAVFGPKPVEQRSQEDDTRAVIKCEYAMAAFSTGERRRRGKADRRATEIGLALRNTLEQTVLTELMPRSQLDVYVQVLSADGGTRCAAINAAFLALAAAAVPMRDIVAACAAGYLEGTPLLDLNYHEDAGGGPDVAVAIHPNWEGGRVVLLQQDNRVAAETFEEVMGLAVAGCRAVATFMRERLLEATRAAAAARAEGDAALAASGGGGAGGPLGGDGDGDDIDADDFL